jgi:hypothetical protein
MTWHARSGPDVAQPPRLSDAQDAKRGSPPTAGIRRPDALREHPAYNGDGQAPALGGRSEEPVTTPGQTRARDKEVRTGSNASSGRVWRGAALSIMVIATATLAVGAGTLARLTDPDDFHSYGDALW